MAIKWGRLSNEVKSMPPWIWGSLASIEVFHGDLYCEISLKPEDGNTVLVFQENQSDPLAKIFYREDSQ